jgi:hypothetical protein
MSDAQEKRIDVVLRESLGESAEAVLDSVELADALVPFYERFGFAVRKRFDLGDGPTVNAM